MEWSRAIRYRHHLSCVMIDVDFFKQINEPTGIWSETVFSSSWPRPLGANVASPDYICRWGGDEFGVLLPETDEQGACTWAERCCAALADTEFYAGPHKLRITASFGVAQRYKDMQTQNNCSHLADQALLVAKEPGDNEW